MRKKSKKTLKKEADKLWAEAVRKRAGYKCEYCGNSNGKIEAHHIFSRRHFSTRWNLENGVALCHYHHLRFAHQEPVLFTQWIRKKRSDQTIGRLTREAYTPAVRINYKKVIELLKEGIPFSILNGEIRRWDEDGRDD